MKIRRSAVLATILLLTWTTGIHAAGAAKAYFAGGCFWCTQEIFSQITGVTSVVSGMMRDAETVEVTYDPSRISYDQLLKVFWRAHDPTQVDRQGPDTGKRYRSAIFYTDAGQQAAAEKSKVSLGKSGKYASPIATEISPAATFTRADEHHQNFCRKNPNNPYVRQYMVPKLEKLGLKTP